MTKQKINIAIAESIGAKREYIEGNGVDDFLWCYPNGDALREPLDYGNDINAIHDACESSLKNDQWLIFSLNLTEIYWGQENMPCDPFNHGMAAIRATAKQRAIAYLKTINKYK